MRYPEKLEKHVVPKYNYLTTFPTRNDNHEDGYFVHAFYHDKTQYPLLMHAHDYYELNIVTDGVGRHYIENNYVDSKKGSVFVIPPNIMHGYYNGVNLEIFQLALSDSFMTKFSKELKSFAGYSMLFEIEPILRKSFNEEFFLSLTNDEMKAILPELNGLVACKNIVYPGITTLKNAKALSIIGSLTYLIHQKKQTIEHNQPAIKNLIKSVEFIHQNYMEKIHVQDLAEMCFMSYTSFSRYFKKAFDMSPSDYIMAYRIKMAKFLLDNTEKTVSQIAQECGFFDQSHFALYFYKIEKVTPAQYRRNKR